MAFLYQRSKNKKNLSQTTAFPCNTCNHKIEFIDNRKYVHMIKPWFKYF